MDLAELTAEVIILTNRPDRTAETDSAVKAATLKAHMTDYYSKDLVYKEYDLGSVDHNHQFIYESAMPLFRNFKSVQRLENTGDLEGPFISIITPEELLDSYHRRRTDICYVAGTSLVIKSYVDFQYAFIGNYNLPDVTTPGFTSWVARLFPWVIVYEAARIVFKALGKTEESNGMGQLFAEQLVLLQTSALTDKGE